MNFFKRTKSALFPVDAVIPEDATPPGGGDMIAANNLSDVANTATANNNLGNYNGTWTPTFTAVANQLNTLTPVQAWNYLIVGNMCFFMGAATAAFDVADPGDNFIGDTPVLRAANFATAYQVVGVMTSVTTVDLVDQKIKAEVGAKTMNIQIAATIGNTIVVFISGSYQLT